MKRSFEFSGQPTEQDLAMFLDAIWAQVTKAYEDPNYQQRFDIEYFDDDSWSIKLVIPGLYNGTYTLPMGSIWMEEREKIEMLVEVPTSNGEIELYEVIGKQTYSWVSIQDWVLSGRAIEQLQEAFERLPVVEG